MKSTPILLFLLLTPLSITILNAQTISLTAKKLNLYAGTKATIQWERVFSSPRRMKKYKINLLSSIQQKRLEAYLIEHSADSEQPIVPGL
jgi:hypothetical protein